MRHRHCAAIAVGLLLNLGGARAAQDQPPSAADQVPSLDHLRLGHVRDDTAFSNWRLAALEDVPLEERDEERVFWQAVLAASKTSPEAFAKAANNQRYLSFGHLYAEPAKYRGQVVHFEGRLARLKQLDPPHWIQLKDIHRLFEAWIYINQPGAHPICVIMPHQPIGEGEGGGEVIDPGDGLDRRVAVDGYLFKRYRYISGRLDQDGNNVSLSTVLLIAPNAKLIAAATPGGESLPGAGSGWIWLGGLALAVIALLGGVVWWLRRGDRQVRNRLETLKNEGLPCVAPGHKSK